MGPSFRWATLLFGVLFDTGEELLIPGKCATCDILLYSCSPVYRDRDNQISIWIIKLTMMIRSTRSCSVLVATDRSSCIPTASVDRCYTVMQTFNGCGGSLLSCQATWYASWWVCAMEDRKSILFTHSYPWSSWSFVNQLHDALIRTSLLMGDPSALLFSLLYGAPANCYRLQHSLCYCFC